MSTSTRLAGVVAIALVAFGVGFLFSRPAAGPAASSAPSPTALPSSPSQAASPIPTSPSQSGSPTATADQGLGLSLLTGTFSSPFSGYSIGTAGGWTVTPATKRWVGVDNSPPAVDQISVSLTDTTISAASQALPKGTTYDGWLAAFHQQTVDNVPPGCTGGTPDQWPPIQIGDQTGRLEMLCNAAEALVEVGGRVYVFDWGNATFVGTAHLSFDAWKELLRSVQFTPGTAK